jgi:hypothetical protein
MKRLRTAQQVIDHLGGMPKVIEITKANRKQISNWNDRFPAATYVVMMRALNRTGATAPARLWNMRGA